MKIREAARKSAFKDTKHHVLMRYATFIQQEKNVEDLIKLTENSDDSISVSESESDSLSLSS